MLAVTLCGASCVDYMIHTELFFDLLLQFFFFITIVTPNFNFSHFCALQCLKITAPLLWTFMKKH